MAGVPQGSMRSMTSWVHSGMDSPCLASSCPQPSSCGDDRVNDQELIYREKLEFERVSKIKYGIEIIKASNLSDLQRISRSKMGICYHKFVYNLDNEFDVMFFFTRIPQL